MFGIFDDVQLNMTDALIWGYPTAIYLHMIKRMESLEFTKREVYKIETEDKDVWVPTNRKHIQQRTRLADVEQKLIESRLILMGVLLVEEGGEEEHDIQVKINHEVYDAFFFCPEKASELVISLFSGE